MGDYTPIHEPGALITSQASAAITAGQVLVVTGVGTVGPAGAAAPAIVGVAAHDAASGAKVTFYARGKVHQLIASGTVTAADIVHSGAAGTCATHTVGTNDAQAFGVALTTATTGLPVEVMEI